MTDSRARTLFTDLRTWLFALALAPLATACGGDEGKEEAGDVPEIDCAESPAPKFSEMSAVWNKCTTCHSSMLTGASRVNAPVGVDFDTYATAKTHAATAMHEVNEGAMPPAGLPALSAEEEDQLYRWASCGTPE
ncbi:hypothetical protein [Nannocystis punicea]|uniref:Cytochrome c domain-containing protein n=1 Tax=Nannocystis punicea TaxID=2995304 RepID=A0ABY7GYK2_9BACT|nr:hypothetical protein [Nannocystis poenicansa]WAS92067.1 hypothetical protein O0S08_38285 [Nannocystis poenicansa]